MIHIDTPQRPLPRRYLTSPGGFAWWYAEILDAQRNGLVLIWSFGLPFLPGYMGPARRNSALLPAEKPSLNLVVYERGTPTFYLLHELEPHDASWNGEGTWRFGNSILTSWVEDGERHLDVVLDCPLTHGQGSLHGHIEITGRAVQMEGIPVPSAQHAEHLWTPLALPASGNAELHLDDGREVLLSGTAYFDRNGGEDTLESIGIDTWYWTRGSFPEGERIAYVLWPTQDTRNPRVIGFTLSPEGVMRQHDDLELTLPRKRREIYGMPTWPWLELRQHGELWLKVEHQARVDNGPFYLRYFTRATTETSWGEGTSEIIVPHRIDLARHRFIVNMRVSSDQRRNSMWVPLFEGSEHGRIKRLAKSLGWKR